MPGSYKIIHILQGTPTSQLDNVEDAHLERKNRKVNWIMGDFININIGNSSPATWIKSIDFPSQWCIIDWNKNSMAWHFLKLLMKK